MTGATRLRPDAFRKLYTYDWLNQLTIFQRGQLNATHDAIVGTPTHSQGWQIDATGNFTSVTSDGTPQARTNDKQNELLTVGAVTVNGHVAQGLPHVLPPAAWPARLLICLGTEAQTLSC